MFSFDEEPYKVVGDGVTFYYTKFILMSSSGYTHVYGYMSQQPCRLLQVPFLEITSNHKTSIAVSEL